MMMMYGIFVHTKILHIQVGLIVSAALSITILLISDIPQTHSVGVRRPVFEGLDVSPEAATLLI